MATVTTVFDPLGKPLAQFDVATVRSYITNNWDSNVWGTAQFSLSRNDVKHALKYLEFGNLIRFHDEERVVEDWVGSIDDMKGRKWQGGVLYVNCVSAERFLEWRELPQGALLGHSRVLLRNVLELVQMITPGGLELELGKVYTTEHTMRMPTVGTLLNFVNHVSKFAGGLGGPVCDYEVQGYVDNDDGWLHLRLNLYDGQRGVDTDHWLTDARMRVLDEGTTEQGEIVNVVYVYSKASSQEGRIVKHARDERSIARYGMRVRAFEGVGYEPEEILYQARAMLGIYRNSVRQIPVAILKDAGLHRFIRRGNKFRLKMASQGFNEIENTVRITGYEIDDEQDQEARISFVVEAE